MKTRKYIIIILLLFNLTNFLQSQQIEKKSLREIAGNISAYKNKTIKMKLKLKCIDIIFEKIIFYDKKNHDIEFDISSKEKKKKLERDLMNLHNGMNYHVTFIVEDAGSSGVIGSLQGFKPVILMKIPDSGSSGK